MPQGQETIFFTLSDEMMKKLIKDIQNCLDMGAKCALVISSQKPDFDEKMQAFNAKIKQGKAKTQDLPEPDIVCISKLYSIGLPCTLEELFPHIQQWSQQGGQRDHQRSDVQPSGEDDPSPTGGGNPFNQPT